MTVKEILELGTIPKMKPHMRTLADHYTATTGRDVCLTCWGDVKFMVQTLKNEQMSSVNKFRLRDQFAIYKMEKGSPETVTAERLTDELAIRYIKINPERAELFSHKPDNWRELCELDAEEAPEQPEEEDCCEEDEEKPCDDCMRATLRKVKFGDLKKQFGDDVKFEVGMTKEYYINEIVKFKLENQ